MRKWSSSEARLWSHHTEKVRRSPNSRGDRRSYCIIHAFGLRHLSLLTEQTQTRPESSAVHVAASKCQRWSDRGTARTELRLDFGYLHPVYLTIAFSDQFDGSTQQMDTSKRVVCKTYIQKICANILDRIKFGYFRDKRSLGFITENEVQLVQLVYPIVYILTTQKCESNSVMAVFQKGVSAGLHRLSDIPSAGSSKLQNSEPKGPQ